MEPLHPDDGIQAPETEGKVLPLPNPWHLWRWRPKNRMAFLGGLGFLAVAFIGVLSNNDVKQQREDVQARMNKPNPSAAAATNPTPAQVQQWGNTLKTAEQQYQAAQQYAAAHQASLNGGVLPSGTARPLTMGDLSAAQSITNAAGSNGAAASGSQAYGGAGTQQDQLKEQQRQLAYKSLFADNVIRQDRTQPASSPAAPTAPARREVEQDQPERTAPAQPTTQNPENKRKALDFDPSRHQAYWLPEGTILEAVLVNRLDGEQPGPVLAEISTNIYLDGTKLLLLPQGAKVIGSASKVTAFGQQRLAVAFHRTIVPGIHQYSIPMEQETPGLSQQGETGLHDKVNSHYASIFGASLAIGAIGGLAQIGNQQTGYGYDPSVQFRNGISQSMAQSSARVLDRFLNRMPTVTIREGTRVRIVLTDDWPVPAYEDMTRGERP
jgi:type IV secretory pathway VirB10-like protein